MVMTKDISISLNLELEIDTDTCEVAVKSCAINSTPTQVGLHSSKLMCTHVVTETERKYGILTIGSRSSVGSAIGVAENLQVDINGSSVAVVTTHKKVRGRIDGLTRLFGEFSDLFSPGNTLFLSYDLTTKVLEINDKK